jgi:acyl-CoA synthetase (AMP-forming)/AMP-acid ligase II/acyl carrier protein
MNYPVFDNIAQLIARQAAARPGAVALEEDGCPSLTYGELGRQAARLAADLCAAGVKRTDRVAVVIPNGREMSVALLGVCSAATAAPLNPAYQESEYSDYFREIRVSWLVTRHGWGTPARSAAAKMGIRVLELTPDAGAIVPEGVRSVARKGEPPEADEPDPQDIALILLTSGSTGRSKKVPLTHRNICVSVADVARTLELTPSDRCLCMWEQFHIGGLVDLLLVPLASGGTVICTAGFDAANFYRLLGTAKPTWYQGVPATVHELLAHARKHGIASGKSSLRLVRVTASALAPKLMDELEEFFGVPVITTFGMTEAAPLITTNLLPPKVRKLGSTGPSCGPEVAVTDEEGRMLPVGEIGEVVVRGENIFSGYEDAPEANERSFRDGWFRTGDTGYLDEDGYLFLKGRIKETINRGGEKITPQEIDDVLLAHPGIAEAVSFHLPHPVLGEDVAAAIVPRHPGALGEEEVRNHVAAHLAPFKVPRKIIFVEGFARNASGKVNRSTLAGTLGLLGVPDYEEPVGEMEKTLAAIWCRELNLPRVGRHDTYAGLGGDSLSTVRMVFELEKTLGRRLSVEQLGVIALGVNSLAKIAARLPDSSGPAAQEEGSAPGESENLTSALPGELPIDDLRSMVMVMGSGSIPTNRPGSPVKVAYPGGTRPPLFWVFNSPQDEMKALSEALGPEQPVYGFYSGSGTVDPAKLSAVAEYYLREIHSLRPAGALILGGNCRGGRVAIRLAKRLAEVGREVSHLCILEMFERSLYDFDGKLQVMFGRQSSEFRYRDFHWGRPGWERPFRRLPRIKWVQGKHASYFSPKNIGVLSATVRSFLADEPDRATMSGHLRDRVIRGIHRMPWLLDAYVRRTA